MMSKVMHIDNISRIVVPRI